MSDEPVKTPVIKPEMRAKFLFCFKTLDVPKLPKNPAQVPAMTTTKFISHFPTSHAPIQPPNNLTPSLSDSPSFYFETHWERRRNDVPTTPSI